MDPAFGDSSGDDVEFAVPTRRRSRLVGVSVDPASASGSSAPESPLKAEPALEEAGAGSHCTKRRRRVDASVA